MIAPKYWLSPVPSRCDICRKPIVGSFYDEKTRVGVWGCVCPACHVGAFGANAVGPGVGQRYEIQEDGRYMKTEG